MLQMIKNSIDELSHDSSSFSQVYMKYIIDVHDRCLDKEISYMLKYSIWDIHLVDRAILNSLESLVELYDQ